MNALAGQIIGAFEAGQEARRTRRVQNALGRYADAIQGVGEPDGQPPSFNALNPGVSNDGAAGSGNVFAAEPMQAPPVDAELPGAPIGETAPAPQPSTALGPMPATPARNAFGMTGRPKRTISPRLDTPRLDRRSPDPRRAAMADLVREGDFASYSQLRGIEDQNRADALREEIAPMVREGRYGDAARTAASGGEAAMANQLLQLNANELSLVKARGERGAATIYAALDLPPAQRAAFMQQNRDLAMEAGVPAEVFDRADWSDTASLRAIANQWQGVATLAGDISLQKFGDSVQTVRTGPSGSTVLDSREIPMTRAEVADQQRLRSAEARDERDYRYRRERDAADDDYRREALKVRSSDVSPNDVIGPVLAKVQAGGVAALSEGERVIFQRWQDGGSSSAGWGAAPASPAPAARPQPGTGTSQGAPARPMNEADFNALPSGAWFVNPADGRTMQKK